MCGIVGKYYFDLNSFDPTDLDRMMRAIVHRGPDDSGTFTDGRVAIGFRRLSIIDTVSGNQPLYNETKNILAFVNGEIYNFKMLRSFLECRNHRFRTNSDCEVIVHLYEEYGEGFVPKLNGMFAFCLYDLERKVLLIARDRMGIKPMYYFADDRMIVFASEIKGILACNDVRATKEKNVLEEYLLFRSLVGGRTFFAGIKAMEPGVSLLITAKGSRTKKYWKAEYHFNGFEPEQVIKKIRRDVDGSVARQMVSDVPVGTLLSGGVDSSWVSSISGKLSPRICSFTVGFNEETFDERPFARLLARTANLHYHELVVDQKQFADTLPTAIRYHDEPLNHANSVQIYLICKYARRHVKVLLTGEGADELFGGYPRYYICKLGFKFLQLGGVSRRVVALGLSFVPTRKIKKLQQFLGLDEKELIQLNSGFVHLKKLAYLFNKESIDIASRKTLLEQTWNGNIGALDNLLLFEQSAYLQSILVRQDKMSMAASIESRVPFLDNEIIALSCSIPAYLKLSGLQPKYLLKKAAERDVPGEIIYKDKVGFGVPIGKWLTSEDGLKPFMDTLLDQAGEMNVLCRPRLEKLIKQHLEGTINHEDVLWPLINYSIWHNEYFNR